MFSADTRALGALAVQDQDGSRVTFASAWADRPVIFVFLRHFG
jgi:hypothetical protein